MLPNNLVEVRKNHKFNLSSLNKWVDNHLENFENIIDIKQFVGGQSNPTFVILFENKERLILRKKPPGKLLPSAHAIEREYRVQKALEELGFHTQSLNILGVYEASTFRQKK